jgi:hypothetical protein
MTLRKTFPYVLLLSSLGLLWVACGDSQGFGFGTFTANSDGTFTCQTGNGAQACVDTTGVGEPDQTSDGKPFVPVVPSGDGPSPTAIPVDNNPIEPSGPPGGVCGETCPNHFDVDSFRPSCSSDLSKQCYHVHQYDKVAPHYAVDDFLVDTKFQFSAAIEGCSDLSFHFRHANKVSGKIELVIGGTRNFISSDASFAAVIGANEADWVTHVSGEITEFRLMPNNLNILVGTQPGMVQHFPPKRHCAFEIQVFCGADKVWEFATYEHISGDRGADCTN